MFSKQLKYYLTDSLTLNLQMDLPAFHMWTITTAHVQDEHLRHITEKLLIQSHRFYKARDTIQPYESNSYSRAFSTAPI